ncbi:hypothetical protein OROHE_003743 [Orobanche hederae]
MEWIEGTVASIKSIQLRQALHQAVTLAYSHEPHGTGVAMNSYLNLKVRVRFLGKANAVRRSISMIVASALMIWKTLICITGSESPVVVVLSESMEPGFARGDILFLHMSRDPIRVGEIVVYNIDEMNFVAYCSFSMKFGRDGRDIPIVHRVIKVHERQDTGEVDILTKGDNNDGDDIPLYAPGQLWLKRQHIMGRAVGFLPHVGWATIIMTEKPLIKYILIGVLGLLVITSKD